jgi:gas vesicle protein
MLKQSWKYLAVAACVLAVACNSGKAPAEAAMKLADEAVASARTEAEQLVPDDFKSLSDELAAAKDLLAKRDYKGALAAAQSIQQKANDVTARAKAKKDELSATWSSLSGEVPKMVEAIKSRVDILSQSKKLPKGLDAAQFTSAKDGLTAATTGWAEAQAAQAAGNWTEAVAKANQVKGKATEVMGLLGMSAGTAAPTN